MSWVATAIIGSAVVTGYGQYKQGEAIKDSKEAEAAWLRRSAGVRRAESQREAAYERRQAEFAQSRVQAVAAASGAGASDPNVVNIQADIEAEGEYRALSRLFAGEDEALGMEYAAQTGIEYGKAAKSAATIGAAATIFGGIADWSMYSSKPKGGGGFYGPPP